MIPLSCKEVVDYQDTDGIIFHFLPKDGMNEMESLKMFDGTGNIESLEKVNVFVNKIVKGWDDPKKAGIPPYPADGNVAAMFPMAQKVKLIGFWHEANTLTIEEKKI